MENPSSSFRPDPLSDDDPHFLSFVSEVNTWNSLVTDWKFMEVLKDDDEINKDGSDSDGHVGKKARTNVDTVPTISSSSDIHSSSDRNGNAVSPVQTETVSRTAVDAEMATVPLQLFDAVGDVDMDFVRNVLDTYFDEKCTFRDASFGGGLDGFYQYLFKSTERTPDMVRVIRHVRVVVDENGNKAVKFKMFQTGTYIKAKSTDIVPDVQGALIVDHLDEESITKKEIATLKASFASTNDTESFSFLAHSSLCWHLNEQGKVRHYDFRSKVLSLKPVKAV